MAKFIYDGLDMIFGRGMVGQLTDFMCKVLNATNSVLNGSLMETACGIFAGTAATLLIIFFYMDMLSKASRDMITLEKLILAFIKVMIAFTILISVKDIVTGLVALGQDMYNKVSSDSMQEALRDTSDNGIVFQFVEGDDGENELDNSTGTYSEFPKWEEVQPAFEWKYNEIGFDIFENLSVFLALAIPTLILMLAKGAAYLASISVAINLIARSLLSPIAVVQCFDEGMKSSGIRYLKKLASAAISVAVMVIVVMASNALSGRIMAEISPVTVVSFSTIPDIITFSNVVVLILPNLALVTATMGATKIADDILGV